MEKRNWKIYYSSYQGPEKRAVELVYRELGKYVLRDNGIYSFHSLDCVREGFPTDCNAIILGTYNENPVFRKYLEADELPENGYAVKVIDNPENNAFKLALLCGYSAKEVLYAAVDFVDDYLASATPVFDAYIHLRNELFCHSLPDYYISSAPSFKTRSIFTWGHPINDYREYLSNMARLKLNQLIVWNDYLPLNADEIVECAHSYGIEVLWGFAWGWAFNCNTTDITDLTGLKDKIIAEFNSRYKNVKGDGIYFQSFTELSNNSIKGVSIASAVTELVNMTAGEILSQNPDLHIQFGLHATSVRNSLDTIAKVDPRVEIVWEDCGGFPYKASPKEFNTFKSLEEYESQHNFADSIIDLRKNADLGIVYKCMLTMDWSRNRVTHQLGPYVMGEMDDITKENDTSLFNDIWRFYSAEWIESGEYVYQLTKHIREKTGGNVNMCMAGMFSGGIWFPTALCAEMFWNCNDDYFPLRKRVLNRNWVRF